MNKITIRRVWNSSVIWVAEHFELFLAALLLLTIATMDAAYELGYIRGEMEGGSAGNGQDARCPSVCSGKEVK